MNFHSLTLKRSLLVGLFAAASMTLVPSMSHAATFTSTLSGEAESPPVTTMGTGTVDATYTSATKVLKWKVVYSGLSGAVTAAHFHGPAMPGQNAGVVLPLSGKLDSPLEGEATLTEAQAAQVMAGQWYVNLHTAANPKGEVRGQLVVSP
ncbi:CHRD domain-containing protein [Aquabacterium sp.]|uniref:CHRD domain-containing protein n=1 Tax=Aquabacterium sp. TaxID=1872578 RepID=UPI002488E194|nr:CHRD domain-containing protein [Aquabacterium sp.]MDI1260406.1 CHRD domain-containing protein [Aquabacterium sp.]